jgi:hypothetical protein
MVLSPMTRSRAIDGNVPDPIAGHFALEDKADEMVPLIRDFLDRKVKGT